MILVTGATGFLGAAICRSLLKNKVPFIALRRERSKINLLDDVKDKITWHTGDIRDIATIEQIIDQVDEVIHAAAIVSFDPRDYEMMEKVNVDATRDLVNLCLGKGIKRFIFISSIAAIGRADSANPLSEKTKWKESRMNTQYGVTKHLAELEVWRAFQEGMKGFILNPSVIVGRGDWSRSSSSLFKYVFREPKYYPGGIVNYVDVRDVTDILLKLREKEITNERFVVNGGNVPYKQFFETIAEALGKKPPNELATPWKMKAAVWLSKLRSLWTGKRPIITAETARSSNSQIVYNNNKIVQLLDFKFRDLQDTINWSAPHYVR